MIKKFLNFVFDPERASPSFDDLPYNKQVDELILFLKSKLGNSAANKSMHERIEEYLANPYKVKILDFPNAYLTIEQYLSRDTSRNTFTQAALRGLISEKYEELLEIDSFRLIFHSMENQELHLSKLLLQNVIRDATDVVGDNKDGFLSKASSWLNGLPEIVNPFLLFDDLAYSKENKSVFFAKIAQLVATEIKSKMGQNYVLKTFQNNYDALAEQYKLLDSFPFIISLIPNEYLDGDKINILSKHQLSKTLLEKVKSLELVNKQLANRNEAFRNSQAQVQIKSKEANYSSRLLSEIMNAVKEGIITANSSSKIIMVNQEAEAIFGYEPGEMIGMPIANIMPQDYRPMHNKGMNRYMRTRESKIMKQNVILEGLRKNGEVFPLEINISNLQIDGQDLFTAAVRDITDRIKIESELRHANSKLEQVVSKRTGELQLAKQELEKLLADKSANLETTESELATSIEKLKSSNAELERFAYIASHDLQEPLRTVGSYVQLIERKFPDEINPELKEYIGFAVGGVKRMQSIIRDLLELSRVGSREVNLKSIRLSDVIFSLSNTMKDRIESSQAEILLENDIHFTADQPQITQLMQNLVGNALKFTKEGTTPIVKINAWETDTAYHFSIADNGIGIEPEFHERIFIIFQRLHNLHEYTGTGIGLALCKKIIDRHNGQIMVESALGEGATFKFSLPKVNL